MTGDELVAAILALPPEDRALQVFDYGWDEALYPVKSIEATDENNVNFAGRPEPFLETTRVLTISLFESLQWNRDKDESVVLDRPEGGSA